MPSETQADKKRNYISIGLLSTVIITLIVGVIAGYVFHNMLVEKQLIFSTASVISFVFTVSLGAASIILAIITIVLSRQAEDALIRRSDEGIKLQTDVFVRTNEVLSKIQSSTGVTEKRIEDIISGRTAIIASEVIEKSVLKGEDFITAETVERIKKDLAESLRNELLPLISAISPSPSPSSIDDRLVKFDDKRKRQQEIKANWKTYRASLVAEARKHSEIQVQSESDGDLGANTPEEFWDAIFIIGDKRYALETHTKGHLYDDASNFSRWRINPAQRIDYARRLSWRISQDNIQVLVIAWDKDVSEEPAIKEILSLLKKSNPKVDIQLVHGTPKTIIQHLVS